jgi:anti-sigma factor RsiW
VSDSAEHRESAEALAAYALGALPDAEADLLQRHLEGCSECRAELDGLRTAVEALPASVEQIEPPPELKAGLMAIVESEAELLRAAGASADQPPAVQPARPWRWLAPGNRRPLLGLAAAGFAAAAVVIALIATGGGSATHTIEAVVSPALRAAGVRASLVVHGTRAQLVVTGLPAPAADHVDELWIQHGRSAPQPAGTFVVSSGSVQVAGAVHAGDEVLVTVEPGRGTSAPTTTPLLVARV